MVNILHRLPLVKLIWILLSRPPVVLYLENNDFKKHGERTNMVEKSLLMDITHDAQVSLYMEAYFIQL